MYLYSQNEHKNQTVRIKQIINSRHGSKIRQPINIIQFKYQNKSINQNKISIYQTRTC